MSLHSYHQWNPMYVAKWTVPLKKKYKFDLSMNFLASTQEHVSISTCGFKTLTGYIQLHFQFGKYLIHQSAFHKLRPPPPPTKKKQKKNSPN